MPRKNYSNDRSFAFTCDQRKTMARHVAGVFSTAGGVIVVKGDTKNGLLDILIERARPLKRSHRRSDVHGALVTEVAERLIDDGNIRLEEGRARMSAKYMEKQSGVSRLLRERAAAARQHPKLVRRPRRQAQGIAA